MQPHQQRVVDEKNELDFKIKKLIDFMHGDTYADLTATNQGLMMVQLTVMEGYSAALGRRIELF